MDTVLNIIEIFREIYKLTFKNFIFIYDSGRGYINIKAVFILDLQRIFFARI